MSDWQSFRRSLAIQARVIHALLMREVITRFGRENIGVLWLIGEPMLFTLGITALWKGVGLHHGSALPISAFALTGYSSVLIWRNSVNRCNNGIQQNLNLLYHRNVRVFDVFVTRILLEVAGATCSFLFLGAFFVAIEWIAPPVDPLQVLWGWLMLIWFGFALAMLIGAASAYSEVVERLWHPAAYLLFPLSGAAFMVDWLPPGLAREFVLFLPMVHGVEMVRDGFFGHLVRTHYDVVYVSVVNLVLSLFALVLLRDATRRVGTR
jgi:ABC-type polysaccharide/polyol phosphate export permease